jgi:hypothetical protein
MIEMPGAFHTATDDLPYADALALRAQRFGPVAQVALGNRPRCR